MLQYFSLLWTWKVTKRPRGCVMLVTQLHCYCINGTQDYGIMLYHAISHNLTGQFDEAYHCTMCTLFHTNSAGLSKLGHILKNPKKYFYEYIFFPALTNQRKMEKYKFLWFSNSKFAMFCDFRVIFPDFECSKNNVSSAGK